MRSCRALSGAVAIAVFFSWLVLIPAPDAMAAKNEGKGSDQLQMERMGDRDIQSLEKRQQEERKTLEKRYKADMEALKQRQQEERNEYQKRMRHEKGDDKGSYEGKKSREREEEMEREHEEERDRAKSQKGKRSE